MRRGINLAIVGVVVLSLTGLVFAAVGHVREAAARTGCANNPHLIGFALWNYHDTQQRFPTATLPSPELPPEWRLCWLFELDPFLHARMDEEWIKYRQEPWDSESDLRLARQRMPLCRCPAAPPRPPDGLALTSYVGATGVGTDAATLPKNDPRAGFFGYDRKLTRADITDDPALTIAVIETAAENGPWMAGGWPTARPFVRDGAPPLGRGGQFGGLHRGGVNVLFVDGSVRFLRDTVDHDTFAALFTIAAGDQPRPVPAE